MKESIKEKNPINALIKTVIKHLHKLKKHKQYLNFFYYFHILDF